MCFSLPLHHVASQQNSRKTFLACALDECNFLSLGGVGGADDSSTPGTTRYSPLDPRTAAMLSLFAAIVQTYRHSSHEVCTSAHGRRGLLSHVVLDPSIRLVDWLTLICFAVTRSVLLPACGSV